MNIKKLSIAERRKEIHDNLFRRQVTEITLLEAYDNLDTLLFQAVEETKQRHKRKYRLIFYKKKV